MHYTHPLFYIYIKILLKTKMTLTINNKTVELKYSFRSLMIYEKITGKSFNPQTLTDVIVYMYSVILGSDPNTDITWDEFMDFIDSNSEEFTKFSTWLSDINEKNASLSSIDKDKIKDTTVDPKKE